MANDSHDGMISFSSSPPLSYALGVPEPRYGPLFLGINQRSQTKLKMKFRFEWGTSIKVLSDFSSFHAKPPICNMFPGLLGGLLSKQRKAMLMKQIKHFPRNIAT